MKVLIFVIFFITNAATGMSAPNVCTTPACVRRGADVKLNMDTSVNPCDNFYKFACGGWSSRKEVPEYASVYGTFQALNKDVMYNISHLMSRSYENPNRIVSSLYKGHSACMLGGNDVGRDNEDAWNKVLQKIGVEEWPNGPGDVTIPLWSKLIGDLMTTFNHKPVVYVDVKRNRVVNKNIIHIYPGSLPVKKAYLDSPYYKSHMLEVVLRINSTLLEDQQLFNIVDQMVGFEKNLAEILAMPSNETELNFVSVMELENDVDLRQSMVDTFLILDNIFKSAQFEVSRNDSVLVREPAKVRLLLKACGQWEKHIVSNVLVWHALQTVGKDVIPSVQELNAAFKSKVRNATRTSSPQTMVCNTALANSAPSAYSMFYIRNFFNNASVPMVQEMVDFQQSLFYGEVQDSKWMDEETTTQAKEKLRRMKSVIGYPKWIADESKVSSYTPTAESIHEDAFVYYYVACAQLHMTNKLRSLHGTADPEEGQSFNAAMVNAYYTRTDNKMVIPAGIIQNPFFDPGLPKYINYATLGYIILHEITHGFDSNGRKYDAKGGIFNWWSPKTEAKFHEKAQCFLDQYGNITDSVTHMKLPSKQTLAEDISDNAAARLSFLAFLKLKKTEKHEMQLLPGLESYTPEQLHFISAAQPWCKKYDPDTKKFVIEEDVHSVSEQRVNIPFGNTPQFAKVFNCPSGSKMNFAKKCSVW
uniref:Endothelin-converting enzyme n=1 Tax=Rhipicephalus appendiculatus TaxID=34631 RepID=A0A131YYQ8_RHIAP